MIYEAEDRERRAKEWIIKIYQQAGVELPYGFDDLEILGSLSIDMAVLKTAAMRAEVRRMLAEIDPRFRN
jgi:hypothetical protein